MTEHKAILPYPSIYSKAKKLRCEIEVNVKNVASNIQISRSIIYLEQRGVSNSSSNTWLPQHRLQLAYAIITASYSHLLHDDSKIHTTMI